MKVFILKEDIHYGEDIIKEVFSRVPTFLEVKYWFEQLTLDQYSTLVARHYVDCNASYSIEIDRQEVTN